jgi:magnesium-protoporphyrin O-methyltransferase
MNNASYQERRGQLEEYFDRTASDTWAKLTSDKPVGRIRATVRAGRDQMRAILLSYLPENLSGVRVLDAGCGTGALAVEAARRGAQVVAIDLAASLVDVARERMPAFTSGGSIDFRVSDMLNPDLGRFDWIVGMDSLIHYKEDDMVEMIGRLAERADRGLAFTFAPRTVLLSAMWMVGKAFPRSDRSPAIEPIAEKTLRRRLAQSPATSGFAQGRCERVDCGFYISQALQLVRK